MTPFVSALMGFFILPGGFGLGPAVFAEVAPILPSYQVSLTGYNAVPAQTDGDPYITASGAYSNPDIVVARSRDLADELPFGTVIALLPSDTSSPDCGHPVVTDMIGLRVIADSMNARIKNTVDVLFSIRDTVVVGNRTRNAANALGICKDVQIKVVGYIDMSDIPETQEELVAMVSGDGVKLAVAK